MNKLSGKGNRTGQAAVWWLVSSIAAGAGFTVLSVVLAFGDGGARRQPRAGEAEGTGAEWELRAES